MCAELEKLNDYSKESNNLWTMEELIKCLEEFNKELEKNQRHSNTSELEKSTGFPFI